MKIVRRWCVYRDPVYYSSFPSVEKLADGSIYVLFRRAPDDRALFDQRDIADDTLDHIHPRSELVGIKLDTDGNPLSEPIALPHHPLAAEQDANLLTLASGRLIQLGFRWRPIGEIASDLLKEQGIWTTRGPSDGPHFILWGSYTRYSDDNGATWSNSFELGDVAEGLDQPRAKGQPCRLASRGRMVETKSGAILLASYDGGIVEDGKSGIAIYRSDDQGASFYPLPQTAIHKSGSIVEPSLTIDTEGNVVAYCRTRKMDDHLVVVKVDEDKGCVDKGLEVPIQGHPHDGLLLADGRTYLAYGYRHEPYGVRARMFHVNQKIDKAEEHTLVDDMPSGDCGYPWSVEVAPGRVLTVYYGADEDGVRGIDAVLVDVSADLR